MLDINYCSSRQLTSLPGIDRRLADNITRHRHDRGRFRHIDDLWTVSGMNRPRFQLIKRHFKVCAEHKAETTPKLSLARLPLNSSMVDFVCKGQSVSNEKIRTNRSPVFRPSLNISHCEATGATRTGKRYRLPSDTESKTRATNQRAAPQSRSRGSRLGRSKTVSPPVKPTSANTEAKGTDKTDKPPKGRVVEKNSNEILPSKAPPADDTTAQYGGSSPKPSFTLKTSPSGNNINFTCTIDKRLMGYPTSLAFQFDQKTPHGTNWKDGGYGLQRRKGGGGERMADEKKYSGDADESSSEDYVTAVGVHPTSPLRHFVNHAELPSIGGSNKQGDSSSSLTEENILLYERKNKPNQMEKKKTIEAWVEDVNDARKVGKLLRGRTRESRGRNFHVKYVPEDKVQPKVDRQESPVRRDADKRLRGMLGRDRDCHRCRDQGKVPPKKPWAKVKADLEQTPASRDRKQGLEPKAPQPGPSRRDTSKCRHRKADPAAPANTPRDRTVPDHPVPDANEVADALTSAQNGRHSEKRSHCSQSDLDSSSVSVPKKAVTSQTDRINYLRHQRRIIEKHPRKNIRNKNNVHLKRNHVLNDKPHHSEIDIQGAMAQGPCEPTHGGEEEPMKKLTHPSRKYHHRDGRKWHGYDRYGKRHQRYTKREEEACKVM